MCLGRGCQIYLVGGAVRDQLLGIPVKERDWVVVGASIEGMLQAGFRPVGKDFPVFLHPETHEEYALARTERKVARGYAGFTFNASSEVSLEEDLMRRDLTINAIAKTSDGKIIDPYHGQEDLKNKILRHVSPAFVEDPVRILRIARFAARFDFAIAPETLILMQSMVKNGEVDALVPERVWKEWQRALTEPYPNQFFDVLIASHAFPILFPELAETGSIPVLKSKSVSEKKEIAEPAIVHFAVLLHKLSDSAIEKLCDRYRVPNDYRELALLIARYLPHYQQIQIKEDIEKKAANHLLDLLLHIDAFRREKRFQYFLSACSEICFSFLPVAALNFIILGCYQAAKSISIEHLTKHYAGLALAAEIKTKRCQAILNFLQDKS